MAPSVVSDATQIPRVGVAVVMYDQRGYILIGKRYNSDGSGTLALPGGHLELHESFEDCAAREVLEETGVTLAEATEAEKGSSRGVRLLTTVNTTNMKDEGQTGPGKHYVTVFMAGEGVQSEDGQVQAQLLEPDKCLGWIWVPPSYLLNAAYSQLALQHVHSTAAQSGDPLPVSVARLVEAERVAEGLRADGQIGGSVEGAILGSTTHAAVADASAARHVPTSSADEKRDLLDRRAASGPRIAPKDEEERKAWDLADDFAMGAILFRPLVSFLTQRGNVLDR